MILGLLSGGVMGDLIKGIQNTPIPTMLIMVGLFILILAFVTRIGGIVEVSPEQNRWAIPIGLFVLVIGLVLNSSSISSPTVKDTPIPSLPISVKSGCEEPLKSKLGRYEGKSIITNSSDKLSGKIILDINREADASCRLIARVEEFSPLAGKGILNGQFDPNARTELVLIGSLIHQTKSKIWDVEMKIQFIDKNSIEGQSIWKPKSGIEDTKTYYETFTVTKSF